MPTEEGLFLRMLAESAVRGSRTCKQCKRVFGSHREMCAHTVFDHADPNRWTCHCGGVFRSRDALAHHKPHCPATERLPLMEAFVPRAAVVEPPAPLKRPVQKNQGPTLRCECGDLFGLATDLNDHTTIIHRRPPTREERTPITV